MLDFLLIACEVIYIPPPHFPFEEEGGGGGRRGLNSCLLYLMGEGEIEVQV